MRETANSEPTLSHPVDRYRHSDITDSIFSSTHLPLPTLIFAPAFVAPPYPSVPSRLVISAKQKRTPSRQTPRSPRAKRPRPPKPSTGFSTTQPDSTTPETSTTAPSPASLSIDSTPPNQSRDLSKRDASGISLEDRLREEIQHPLRKPKLTLFVTLAFSATLGMFFALARVSKDGVGQVTQNVAVDIAAISLFGYLAWREVQFGRRSLNSIAGCPQASDLKIVMLNSGTANTGLPFGGSDSVAKLKRLEALLGGDVLVVSGRGSDVKKYLERGGGGEGISVVALITDGGEATEEFEGVAAVASGEADDMKDWVAWLGDAVPPRKNISLFRIARGQGSGKSASGYVVAVGLPTDLPTPQYAKRD